MEGRSRSRSSTPPTPPPLSPSILPESIVPEVSMVEAEDVTGVTFTPELWMQRRHWALEVLRKEQVRSVMDIGCGTGSLLETLVIPPSTIYEPPITQKPIKSNTNTGGPSSYGSTSGSSQADDEGEEEEDVDRELFILRAGGLDSNSSTTTSALSIITPPSSSTIPRWEPLSTELWLGGMERYNSRLEGYEAMTALEVIEHLDPHILSRFGVVTMGTYRPRILLVTTPNFDFNAKFPREHGHDAPKKGFVDPTGRTERVFRHSDHKLEMTHAEFVEWATSSAADWGYSVEIGGVGTSSKPSFYPSKNGEPPKPVYATSTALFRIGASGPARSPRSVRTTELPFMPGSSQSSHPHELAGKFLHPRTAPTSHHSERLPPSTIRELVKQTMETWQIGEVSMNELWGNIEVAGACAGSKRYLVGCLGGWGNVDSIEKGDEFEVTNQEGRGLVVIWKGFKGREMNVEVDEKGWGQVASQAGDKVEAGGW